MFKCGITFAGKEHKRGISVAGEEGNRRLLQKLLGGGGGGELQDRIVFIVILAYRISKELLDTGVEKIPPATESNF